MSISEGMNHIGEQPFMSPVLTDISLGASSVLDPTGGGSKPFQLSYLGGNGSRESRWRWDRHLPLGKEIGGGTSP